VSPAQVDLTTGLLPKDAHFEEVSAIRFQKALPTDLIHPPDSYETIAKGLVRKERSAFVVNVSHLPTWLLSLRQAENAFPTWEYPWSNLLR
jgi:hypothetical protein